MAGGAILERKDTISERSFEINTAQVEETVQQEEKTIEYTYVPKELPKIEIFEEEGIVL